MKLNIWNLIDMWKFYQKMFLNVLLKILSDIIKMRKKKFKKSQNISVYITNKIYFYVFLLNYYCKYLFFTYKISEKNVWNKMITLKENSLKLLKIIKKRKYYEF
jgi:hypothetical protein